MTKDMGSKAYFSKIIHNTVNVIFFRFNIKHLLCMASIAGTYLLSAQTPYRYVNTLIGTAPASTTSARRHGEGSEEKGQTIPSVGRPFGMTQWCVETRTTEVKCIAPYYYNDKYISGFRATHWMSGSCTQDYGSITVMPFTTTRPDTLKFLPVSKFSHRNETAAPAYYKVLLDSYNTTAELTGSVRSGMMKFTFPGKQDGFIIIRVNSDEKQGRIIFDSIRNEIICINPVHRIYQGWGESAGFFGNFVIQFSKKVKAVPWLAGDQQLVVSVGKEPSVTLRIGSSFTSAEEAKLNLEKEIRSWDFGSLRTESENIWNQTLGKISVRGGSDDDLVKFYTALYHCYQLPRIVSDADGSYPGFAQDSLIHRTDGFDYYDDFSMWDTYRALHPLITILEPERTRDMIRSLILKAQQGGWMPVFPAWSSYTAAMIGDHVSTFICDAYLKGIIDFDTAGAYKYMRKNAFESPSEREYTDGKGRRALKSYLNYGYIPMEDSVWDAFHKNEQVSRTLEYALDDYALSRFAKATGHNADYDILNKRSSYWKNVFDTVTGYVRGRYADGKWFEPFNPFQKVKYICEGTPYHYTWYVPHDIPGLELLMGGRESFLDKLETFFSKGYYWHGNEPGHQAPYLFSMAGNQAGTQKWVQTIISDEYDTGPGGLSGNEDAGQMSAWLVFSMMGFYPVCPASNQYIITTPIFDEVRIALQGNKKFIITSLNRSPGTNYIRAITKNGGRHNDWFFTHEDILKGSAFTFQLTPLSFQK